ncbi:glycosyl transferase family 25 [Chitinophaga dinghuensis]|uniref:Glycosyl transferase family 25 n=1 Tax=Chitinophaga dinghuensis TaxID=1539050 RepID=A0A327VNF7_9BACT|nr:glycosyl transferase [Chitinophaga dinghuensis]RAJ76623.1 glycosyl transferase family 25 [Chitinophaga dinghuensis]
MDDFPQISTYIINLPSRKERLTNVLEEFKGRSEFDITVVEAKQHTIGAYGLWMSICSIVEMAIDREDDVIIVCEDDHQFTEDYNKAYLFENIEAAYAQGCELLCGGISGGFNYVLPVSSNRIWVNAYWCNQFLIIYKRFFTTILYHTFDLNKKVDQTLSGLSLHKMVLFPFVSIQRYYGYSDVTAFNGENPDWAQSRFLTASRKLEELQSIYKYYHQ